MAEVFDKILCEVAFEAFTAEFARNGLVFVQLHLFCQFYFANTLIQCFGFFRLDVLEGLLRLLRTSCLKPCESPEEG